MTLPNAAEDSRSMGDDLVDRRTIGLRYVVNEAHVKVRLRGSWSVFEVAFCSANK